MPDTVSVDFLILADSAQVQGDKLYMLGGGWSLIWAKEFPVQHQVAIAAGILVPWMDTNSRHRFRLQIRLEDGTSVGDVAGEFEQGRPAGLPAGTTQRVLIAINIGLRFERAGEAIAELAIDDVPAATVPFRIVQRPAR